MKARRIDVGDFVMLTETARARRTVAGLRLGDLCTNGFVSDAPAGYGENVWVRWEYFDQNRPISISDLVRIPFENPFTDLPHTTRYRPSATQRVLADRLIEQGRRAAARAVCRPWRHTRWRGAPRPRALWVPTPGEGARYGVDYGAGRDNEVGMVATYVDRGVYRLEIRDSIAGFQREMAALQATAEQAARVAGEIMRRQLEAMRSTDFAEAMQQRLGVANVRLEGEQIEELRRLVRESGRNERGRSRKTKPGPPRREWWRR